MIENNTEKKLKEIKVLEENKEKNGRELAWSKERKQRESENEKIKYY